jgi:hypothetical protein
MSSPNTSSPPTGTLLLGGVDSSQFTGKLVPFALYEAETSGHYYLPSPNVTLVIDSTSPINIELPPNTHCLFDSGTPANRFPSAVTSLLAQHLNGTSSDGQYMTIECDLISSTSLQFGFTNNEDESIEIFQPLGHFADIWGADVPSSGLCTVPIEEGSFDCVFGQFFLAEAYTVVHLGLGEIALARAEKNAVEKRSGGTIERLLPGEPIPFADYGPGAGPSSAPSSRAMSSGARASGAPASRGYSTNSAYPSPSARSSGRPANAPSYPSDIPASGSTISFVPVSTESSSLSYSYVEGEYEYDVYVDTILEYPVVVELEEDSTSSPSISENGSGSSSSTGGGAAGSKSGVNNVQAGSGSGVSSGESQSGSSSSVQESSSTEEECEECEECEEEEDEEDCDCEEESAEEEEDDCDCEEEEGQDEEDGEEEESEDCGCDDDDLVEVIIEEEIIIV